MKAIKRLENILNEYEDSLWLNHLIYASKSNDISPLPEPYTLRKALLERDVQTSMQICNVLSEAGPAYKFFLDNASDLADWNLHSKRIYSLSNALCEMLLATDLPDFSAEGIKWVTQTFVIQLEKPVTSPTGKEHDFILCSYIPGIRALSIRSYPKAYDDYQPVDDREKRRAEKDAKNHNPGFEEFIDKFARKTANRIVTGFTCRLLDTKSYKENLLECAPADEKGDWEIMFQLAVGINLYLQSARGDDQQKVTIIPYQHPVPGKKKKIGTGAELFELSVSKAFSSKSYRTSPGNESGGSIRPHFRRGYWRRPSGSGGDPAAPATIWVRPTWVRKDKIDDGENPTGSFQNVPKK